MPDAKRPHPKRRAPASRPGGAAPVRRAPRATPDPAARATPDDGSDTEVVAEKAVEPIRKAIAEAAEQQAEQRFGSAARRAAILAAVVCVLTLTIAGPVRTYFGQRAEVKHNSDIETQLRSQIADLEQQKLKLADPAYIASQARERLGFVMPGDIPYQVQLPPGVGQDAGPGPSAVLTPSGQPWYTSLWHTIADAPHGISSTAPVPPVAPPGG